VHYNFLDKCEEFTALGILELEHILFLQIFFHTILKRSNVDPLLIVLIRSILLDNIGEQYICV
jgi:hypothetical protein